MERLRGKVKEWFRSIIKSSCRYAATPVLVMMVPSHRIPSMCDADSVDSVFCTKPGQKDESNQDANYTVYLMC